MSFCCVVHHLELIAMFHNHCTKILACRRPDGSVGMALVLPALTDCRWWFESLLVHSGVSSATRRKATGADQKKKHEDTCTLGLLHVCWVHLLLGSLPQRRGCSVQLLVICWVLYWKIDVPRTLCRTQAHPLLRAGSSGCQGLVVPTTHQRSTCQVMA